MTYGRKVISICSVVVIVLSSALHNDVEAADLTLVKESNTIWIIGDIQHGDALKFQSLLSEADFVSEVVLASKGGDLTEAMKIGRMIRQNFISTQDAGGITPSNRCSVATHSFGSVPPMTPEQERSDCACYSACFVIWVGGVPRTQDSFRPTDGRGGLGIHRPRFNSTFFAGLTAAEAEAQYDVLVEDTKSYLVEMDVPSYLIEKMFSVSSSNMYLLSRDEIEGMSTSPAIAEWFKSKCGELSASDRAELAELQYAVLLRTLRPEDEPRFRELWKRRIDIIGCRSEARRAEQESRRQELGSKQTDQSAAVWTCNTKEAGSSVISIYQDHLILDTGDGEKMLLPLMEEPEPGWTIGTVEVDPDLGNFLVLVGLEPASGKTVRQLVDTANGEVAFHSEGSCTPAN